MATTTTNYGFDVPTSSDLVKNGATQIALLGQDIDTFLFRPFTRNGVLNSSMNVWQRGTSISYTNNEKKYAADRWEIGSYNGSGTVSRQATGDTTNLPNIQYCLRFQRTAGQTATGGNFAVNTFETLNSIPFTGKTITFSYYARKGADLSGTFTPVLVYGTGTDQNPLTGMTGQTTLYNTAATLTTTWQRFTFSVAVPSTSTQLAFYFQHSASGTAGANDYFEVTGVQLEVGNQASPYAPATPTYATELAACQRYYQVVASGLNKVIGTGSAYTASQCDINIFFAEMRIAPSLVATSGTGYYKFVRNGGTDPFDSITLNGYTTTHSAMCYNNTEISSTAGNAGWVYIDNASGSVALNAEL
jgi:hypothetical protein